MGISAGVLRKLADKHSTVITIALPLKAVFSAPPVVLRGSAFGGQMLTFDEISEDINTAMVEPA